MSYRKKPLAVEVWQFTKENYIEGVPQHIRQAIRDGVITLYSQHGGAVIGGSIETLEGVHTVSENDWIIKGVHGEFYPCKPDIFAETYEPDEPPRPLTLKELRGMDGKPVYIVYNEDGDGMWRVFHQIENNFGAESGSGEYARFEDGSSIEAWRYRESWTAYPTEPGREL